MLDVNLQAITPLSESVLKLTFTDPANQPLPAFEAGAHIDVRVNDAITRQYSLCSSPSERYAYSVAVLRDPNSRGGSAAIHASFQPGQRVQISAPRNLFALNPEDAKTVLVAGGIGITPIMSMAHALAEQGKEFTVLYVNKPGSALRLTLNYSMAFLLIAYGFFSQITVNKSKRGWYRTSVNIRR